MDSEILTIGFGPHSYMEINLISIGYVHLCLPHKLTDLILPCQCKLYIIEKVAVANDVNTGGHQLRSHDSFQWRNGGQRFNPMFSDL